MEQKCVLTYTKLSGGNLCECDQQCHFNRLTGKKQVESAVGVRGES